MHIGIHPSQIFSQPQESTTPGSLPCAHCPVTPLHSTLVSHVHCPAPGTLPDNCPAHFYLCGCHNFFYIVSLNMLKVVICYISDKVSTLLLYKASNEYFHMQSHACEHSRSRNAYNSTSNERTFFCNNVVVNIIFF